MAQPLPRPDFRILPTEEEFAAWCENPVTRFVAAAYSLSGDLCEASHRRQSWEHGIIDPRILDELRVRADCYRAFVETGWLAYLEKVDPDKHKEIMNERRIAAFETGRLQRPAKITPTHAGAAEPRHDRRRRAGTRAGP